MEDTTITKELNYRFYVNRLYERELGFGAKFSMLTSLSPAVLTDDEAQGFVNRYSVIKTYLQITQELFKKSLFDSELTDIREVVLNEVNSEFSLDFHKKLYSHNLTLPYFFRTDEAIPGKLTEIQFEGSGWGVVQALQSSMAYASRSSHLPIREFNKKCIARSVSDLIKSSIHETPFIFHQIDESSNMLDTNYFISTTRKYGLKYIGHDSEVTFKNVNFVRSHSFMEEVTDSLFDSFLERYYQGKLIFDIFPSIIFFEKIALVFPFWKETKDFYPDSIRQIFPFSSFVTDVITLETGETMTIDQFSNMEAHNRDYYLKYAGADGRINWGSKAVYNLAGHKSQCKSLLESAAAGWRKKQPWMIQKAYHRKEKLSYLVGETMETSDMHSKWSGFYGPGGFLGGSLINRKSHKVHGQDDSICRLIL